MLDFLNKRPMLLSAIVSSVISVIGIYSGTALFIIFIMVLSVLFFVWYKRIKPEVIFSSFVVLLVITSLFFKNNVINKADMLDGSDITGEFVVVSDPENRGDFYSTILETVESDTLKKGDKITVTYNCGVLDYSQIIKAKISLSSLGENNYKNSFYSNNIYFKGYVSEFENIGKNDWVLQIVGRVREYIKDTIFKSFQRPQAATMLALLTGNRDYFTDEFYSNVKSAGVAHVMVVSGMHLSVIVSMFLYISNKFFYNRFLKAATVFAATIAVMAVCGFTMSILRAGITYLLICLSLLLDRQNTPENTLGGAVSIILIINPYVIFNVAFLLSVLSTFAILAVALPVVNFVTYKRYIKSEILLSIFASVVISLATLLFTLPVTIYVFGYVSNVSVITNLLISSAATVALISCIFGFLLPFLSGAAFALSEIVIFYVNSVINDFGSLPFATTNLPKMVVIVGVVLIITVLWILLACKKRKDMLKLKEIRLKKSKEGGVKHNGNSR